MNDLPRMDSSFLRPLPHQRLLKTVFDRADLYRTDPRLIFPWLLRPCVVRVLLVTDGGLDFSQRDFGLSTFVSSLQQDGRHYVEFALTLAHLREGIPDDGVMLGAPGIARSIKGLRFDDPNHFAPNMYDEVWLFGIETDFHRVSMTGVPAYPARRATPATYPADRLADQELRQLSAFMDAGGGLFATGDHGLLGRCLGGSVKRARSMRLWASTSGNNAADEVSMDGARRNDTNRTGHDPSSQFNDQSDDVPQSIQPRLYHRRINVLVEARFPHPLLCGPGGVINVLPDHPHEGECVVPGDLTATYAPDGSAEYPPAPDGSTPAPEIIAQASVQAGNNAFNDADNTPTKQATQAHSFGVICAYDGHRAGVGRVVTDATWHHFVNINLIGQIGLPETTVKGQGFLWSAVGQAHLEAIKAYYRNIAVWIARVGDHVCFRRKLLWGLLYQHRIMEAVFATPDVTLERANVKTLYEIGVFARDVLGRSASRCQSERIIIDLVWPRLPDLIPDLDPWFPFPEPGPDPPPVPWLDPTPLLTLALGGALIALREAFPFPDPELAEQVDKEGDALIERGAAYGLRLGLESFAESLKAQQEQVEQLTRNL
jgi:hypothetical protein